MVGSRLKSNVEGDLNAVFTRFLYQPAKVFKRAQLRMNGFVSAFSGPDGPRAADIAFGRIDRVVFAFAESCANRVNRRKIKDVKPKFSDIRQTCLTIGKCTVFARFRG